MIKFFLFLFTLLMATFSGHAQKAPLNKQLKTFIPKGFLLRDTAFGDLNNDRKTDVVLVIYDQREDNPDFVDTAMDMSRPLLILLQQPDGKLQLAKRNDNLVLCKSCGGMMGDPLAGITIRNNSFTVEFSGGSSWRWDDEYGFGWNASKQTWQLNNESHTSFQTTEPSSLKKTKIPATELGDLTIDNFDINKAYEQGSAQARVIAARSYFFNAPNPATKRKGYVMKGDVVTIVREYKTYFEVSFMNKNDQASNGFLLKKDLVRQ